MEHERLIEFEITTTVKVYDSPPGTGKSSLIFQELNEGLLANTKFLYVAPYLGETIRAAEELMHRQVVTPENSQGKSKSQDLYELIELECNIALTQKLFMEMNIATQNLIHEKGYALIMDEVIAPFDKVEISRNDLVLLLQAGVLVHDDTGRLRWSKDIEYGDKDDRFYKIKSYADAGKLRGVGQADLLRVFSESIFFMFLECHILTHSFHSSPHRLLYDSTNVMYEYMSVKGSREAGYRISDFSMEASIEHKVNCKQLINLVKPEDHPKHFYEGLTYSGLIDKKDVSDKLKALSNSVNTVLKNNFKAKSKDTLIVMFGGCIESGQFKPGRYKLATRKMIQQGKLKKSAVNTLLPVGTRATNDFADRFNVVYAVRRNINPVHLRYLQSVGVVMNDMDKELYSLSEAVQSIFRARIRSQQPINLYLPDIKMYEIFNRWLTTNDYENYMAQIASTKKHENSVYRA